MCCWACMARPGRDAWVGPAPYAPCKTSANARRALVCGSRPRPRLPAVAQQHRCQECVCRGCGQGRLSTAGAPGWLAHCSLSLTRRCSACQASYCHDQGGDASCQPSGQGQLFFRSPTTALRTRMPARLRSAAEGMNCAPRCASGRTCTALAASPRCRCTAPAAAPQANAICASSSAFTLPRYLQRDELHRGAHTGGVGAGGGFEGQRGIPGQGACACAAAARLRPVTRPHFGEPALPAGPRPPPAVL